MMRTERFVRLEDDDCGKELSADVGMKVALEGLLGRGQFGYFVKQPEKKGNVAVSLHADPNNKEGRDALGSLGDLRLGAQVQVIGVLHEFAGDKPNKTRSELDVLPYLTPHAKIYWIEIVQAQAL